MGIRMGFWRRTNIFMICFYLKGFSNRSSSYSIASIWNRKHAKQEFACFAPFWRVQDSLIPVLPCCLYFHGRSLVRKERICLWIASIWKNRCVKWEFGWGFGEERIYLWFASIWKGFQTEAVLIQLLLFEIESMQNKNLPVLHLFDEFKIHWYLCYPVVFTFMGEVLFEKKEYVYELLLFERTGV